MERHVVWEALDGVGTEHLSVEFDDGIRADGVVVGVAAEPFRVRYRVRCDDEGVVRNVEADPLGSDIGISLEHDGDGNWTKDGEPVPALSGCRDADITVTPFTNTIPIRRLELDPDESATIRVAYLDVPAMTVERVDQRYTCLDPLDDDGGLFRYESVDGDFTADLSVDPDGLVRDYPGLFERAYP